MSECELVRCTSCRGTKKVARLGGIMGDCMACNATGKIKASDKPKQYETIVEHTIDDIKQAVDKVKPEHDIVTVFNDELVEEIKTETKNADNVDIIKPVKERKAEELKPHSSKAKYKRKTISK